MSDEHNKEVFKNMGIVDPNLVLINFGVIIILGLITLGLVWAFVPAVGVDIEHSMARDILLIVGTLGGLFAAFVAYKALVANIKNNIESSKNNEHYAKKLQESTNKTLELTEKVVEAVENIAEANIEYAKSRKTSISFQFITRWHDVYGKHRHQFQCFLGKNKFPNPEEKKKFFNSHEDDFKANWEERVLLGFHIAELSNFFEEMSQAITYDIAEEAILKRYFRSLVTSTFEEMKPIFTQMRELQNNPRIYIEFETLYNKWK